MPDEFENRTIPVDLRKSGLLSTPEKDGKQVSDNQVEETEG